MACGVILVGLEIQVQGLMGASRPGLLERYSGDSSENLWFSISANSALLSFLFFDFHVQ